MTTSDLTCSECGEVILDEPSSGDPAQRKPCPRCGSRARTHDMRVSLGGIRLGGTAQLSVTRYPEALLTTASNLLEQNHYGISVIVAHMACEVAAERALSAAFSKREIKDLEEAVLAFLNGYNLGTKRTRDLYVALTGDAIHQEPFWQSFNESVVRRNRIIHESAIVDRQEAEASLQAAQAIVKHLLALNP